MPLPQRGAFLRQNIIRHGTRQVMSLTNYTIINDPLHIILNMLLYGDKRFCMSVNIEILNATLSYIVHSKRFDKIEAYINAN